MILVTGATGIVGRVITLHLIKKGYKVRATKRKSSNIEEVKNSYKYYTETPEDIFKKIEWVDTDFQDIESIKKALDGVTEVYHTAAFVSFDPKNTREMEEINISGTKKLLYACENSSVRKLCHISSIATLDGTNEKGKVDETCDYNAKLNHSDYAITKQISEMEVWRASAEGLNTIIINPGIIIGSGNWNKSSGSLFATALKSPFAFPGSSAYVDVRDVSQVAIKLMEGNHFAQRFIITAENWKYKEIQDYIRKKVGKKPTKLLPNFIIKALPFITAPMKPIIPMMRMATHTNMNTLTTQSEVSNEKIIKTIPHTFIPIQESIAFHLNNYLSKN